MHYNTPSEKRGGARAIGKNDPTASIAKRGRHDTGRQYGDEVDETGDQP